LGGTATRKTDVRVIAATNKNLQEQVDKGTFRADLFYRLNVIKISLPPLAERREDIPLLVDHFINKFNKLKNKKIKTVSPDVLDILMRHEFPGNVRELENIIEYCFVLCHGDTIEGMHLPEGLVSRISGEEADFENLRIEANPLLNAEASTIFDALQRFNGHRGKSASYLGIDKATLWRKMKKFDISFPAGRE
jgi:transcriptional regulator with PAS, ATPase and Fis domain